MGWFAILPAMRQIKAAIAGILALFAATTAVAQTYPTMPANTVMGRLGTGPGPAQAIPNATLFSANLFDTVLGTTRGMIPYRGASGWTGLAPGAAGSLLQSGGAGADPSWLALPLSIAKGGTGQITAAAARGSSGLNVEGYTGRGDAIYTILSTDRVIGTTAAFTASRTWTLPAASSVNPGQEIVIADYFGGVTSVNTLVIARSGSDTINGATSVSINAAYGAYRLRSDGTSKWSALISSASNSSSSIRIKTPLDYGAACDGTTDDSIALQAWFDGIRNYAYVGWGIPGATCIFGNNTDYGGVFASMVSLRSNTIIYGNWMTLKLKNSAQDNAGIITYDGTGHPNQTSGVSNLDMSKLIIDGNRANQTNSLGTGAMLFIISSTRVTLRDIRAINGRGDGIYIGGDSGGNGNTTLFHLERVEATGNYRTGLAVVGASRGTITSSIFNSTSNTNNDGTQCGVDFEADGSSTSNTFITIENSSAVGNGGTLSTTGASGFCFFGGFNSNLIANSLTASGNQKYGLWSGTPGEVTVTGLRGTTNGTGLITGATDWLPSNVQKGASNSCGTGFACIGVPN